MIEAKNPLLFGCKNYPDFGMILAILRYLSGDKLVGDATFSIIFNFMYVLFWAVVIIKRHKQLNEK